MKKIVIPVITFIILYSVLFYLRVIGSASIDLMVFLSWLCFLFALLSVLQVYSFYHEKGATIQLRLPRVIRLVPYIIAIYGSYKYLIMIPFVSAIMFNLPILLILVILGIFVFFLDLYGRVIER